MFKGSSVFALISLTFFLIVAAQEVVTNDPRTLLTTDNAQALRGAELYDQHCAVCHGDTALGYAEAKLAFPEDHRHCTRCHRTNNPQQMIDMKMQITPKNSFAIGDPPALRGEASLQPFPTALALYQYMRATMPRYEPGRLSDQAYLDITAFLASVHGVLLQDTLTEETAQHVRLE